jgi:5-(carboxyamino)imidazole ribonucleotide mutase
LLDEKQKGKKMSQKPIVGILMGSNSDWDTMQNAAQTLTDFGVAYEAKVVSAHRMPDDMFAYAETAAQRGIKAIIAGAGGAAHLPGMLAAKTIVPIFGVPVASKHLSGEDSLLSIVQMPKGIPVATCGLIFYQDQNPILISGSALSGISVSKWEPFLDDIYFKTRNSVYSLHQLD